MSAYDPKRTPDACVTNRARTFFAPSMRLDPLGCRLPSSVRQVGGEVEKVSDTETQYCRDR
jgi:hypothetical protein